MAADSEDQKPAHLRVIEGGGEDPREKAWAKQRMNDALVVPTANILRVVRGAGRP